MNKYIIISICVLLITPLSPVSSESAFEYPYNFELNVVTTKVGPLNGIVGEYIKNALLPLGIHLNIIPYHFSIAADSFLQLGAPELDKIPPWDMFSGVSFASSTPFISPKYSYWWKYHTLFYFTCKIFALCDEDWQDWQVQDTGNNQTMINKMLEDLAFEENTTRAIELNDGFNKLFFEELLYELPLTSRTNAAFFWDGFELSALNDISILSQNQEAYYSIYKGLKVTVNHPERAVMRNSTTFKTIFDVPEHLIIDRNQEAIYFDDFYREILLINSLLTSSWGFYDPSPDLAISWTKEDWVDENNTLHPNAKDTFIIRDDAYWGNNSFSPNTDYHSYEKVTVKDFKFSLDIQKLHPESLVGHQADYIDNLLKYSINETEKSLTMFSDVDTWEMSDQVRGIMDLAPTPEFLLNKTLTYNETLSGNPEELDALGLSFYETEEWDRFETSPISAGAYEIVNYVPGEKVSLRLRDDYYYPNEWDSPNDHFMVHQPKRDPVFFTYNSTTEEPKRKPTKTFFDVINVESMGNNTLETIIKEGLFDILVFNTRSITETIIKMHDDPRFNEHLYKLATSPESIYFNLNNPHLKKLNVRKAIAKVIDLDEISEFVDGYWIPQKSLVGIMFESTPYNAFYKVEHAQAIKYDYSLARDLMRSEGYIALDTNIIPYVVPSIPPPSLNPDVPFHILPVIVSLVIYTLIRKKRIS